MQHGTDNTGESPQKADRPRRRGGRWRELGGQVSAYYRLLDGGHFEIMGRIQHRGQIAKLVSELQLRLEHEHDLLALKAKATGAAEKEPELVIPELTGPPHAGTPRAPVGPHNPDRRPRSLEESLSEIPTLGPVSARRHERRTRRDRERAADSSQSAG
jgi:hypothetical protein